MIEPRQPLPEQVTEHDLAGGESHVWRIELEAGQVVSVKVEQQGVDVALWLYRPGGEEAGRGSVPKMDGPYGSWGVEELSWVAEESGTYRLEVGSENPDAVRGKFSIWFSLPRQATETDRRHAALLVELCQADRSRRSGGGRVALLEARAGYRRSLEGWRELGDVRWQLQALQRLGAVAKAFDEDEVVRKLYAEARDLAVANQLWSEAIRNENRLAGLALDRRDLERARQRIDRASEWAREHGEEALLANAESNRIVLLFYSGKIDEAVQVSMELAGRWGELGRPLDQATVWQNLATILDRQGKGAEAVEAYERCLAARKAGGDEHGVLTVLVSLAGARYRTGQYRAALEALAEARPELDGTLSGRWIAHADHFEALALAEIGIRSQEEEPAEISRALGFFASARQRAGELGDRGLSAEFAVNHGALLLQIDQADEAFDLFEQALKEFADLGDPKGEAMAGLGAGLALRKSGQRSAALIRLERAVALVEAERLESASWDFRMAFLASRHTYFEELVDLLVEMEAEEPSSAYVERALEAVERWRGRTFLDSIEERVQLRSDVRPELLEAERLASEELRRLERDAGGGANPSALLDRDARRQEVLLRLDAVRTQIRAQHPQFAEITRPAPVGAEGIRRRLLDRGSTFLFYFLGRERSFVFKMGGDGALEVFPLKGREDLAGAVSAARNWVDKISSEVEDRRDRNLEALADELLGPVLPGLVGERLVIVPDGFLELVPFAALRIPTPVGREEAETDPTDSASGRSYVVEHFEVALLPSASSLVELRREQARRGQPAWEFALFGDPVFSANDPRVRVAEGDRPKPPDLPESVRRTAVESGIGETLSRLHATRDEVDAIFRMLPPDRVYRGVDFDSNRGERFLEYLQNSRVVHLATHGLVDRRQPELSALALSLVDREGRPVDGLLYAYELYSMRLAADLVVLSACRTGVGPAVSGEGVRGLARAFLYSGVPRVVMSLWNVEDASTATLMTEFYRQFLREGLEPSAALREAQLSLLRNEASSAPLYWAPFVLVGDWQNRPRGDGGPDIPIEADDGGSTLIDPSGKGQAFDKVLDEDREGDEVGSYFSAPRPSQTTHFDRDDYINGIDAETGQLLEPGPDAETLLEHEAEAFLDLFKARQLKWWHKHHAIDDPLRLPIFGVNPERLDEAGWAVLWAPGVTDEVKAALAPLTLMRKRQAGRFYREIDLPAGMTSQKFRFDFTIPGSPEEGALGFGPADPEILPYYLLIVGDPREIAFELQYELDVQYAVGRLHLENPADYGRYAATVKRYEESQSDPQRRIQIFGVEGDTDNDRYLIEALVDPLTHHLRHQTTREIAERIFRSESQRKADLERLLAQPPGFLFAAGHGLRIPDPESSVLAKQQGALVCADYLESERVDRDTVFGGDDIERNTNLRGLVAFLYGCYSAGVPKHDEFFVGAGRRTIAPYPMVSYLAKRMLAQGAQAVVGHVDRAWTTSFDWSSRKGDQIRSFSSACRHLVGGGRLGHAMEWINQRYSECTANLEGYRGQGFFGSEEDRAHFLRVRKATYDARNYIVVGDPAVRLPGFGGGDPDGSET